MGDCMKNTTTFCYSDNPEGFKKPVHISCNIIFFLNRLFSFKGIFTAGAFELVAHVPDTQSIASGTVAAMKKGGTYMLISYLLQNHCSY